MKEKPIKPKPPNLVKVESAFAPNLGLGNAEKKTLEEINSLRLKAFEEAMKQYEQDLKDYENGNFN